MIVVRCAWCPRSRRWPRLLGVAAWRPLWPITTSHGICRRCQRRYFPPRRPTGPTLGLDGAAFWRLAAGAPARLGATVALGVVTALAVVTLGLLAAVLAEP